MPRALLRRLSAVAAVVFALAAAISAWSASGRTTTDDRNGDGRPDVWRTYDRHGRLVELAVDSNFDGRSDVHEYYTADGLVRRESDRNFDDRVDLVEEFDALTHAHVRSTVDADFDGTADLVVWFQDGRPVQSSWASDRPTPAPSAPRTSPRRPRQAAAPMIAFADPFAADAAMHGRVVPADAAATVAVVATMALVVPVAADRAPVCTQAAPDAQRPRGPTVLGCTLRGPPLV